MEAVEFIAPVFGVILTGYALAKRGIFSRSDIDGIIGFVQRIAVPFLLFISFARQEIPAAPPWELWIGYYVPSLVIFGACALLGWLFFARTPAQAVVAGASGGFSNTALVGIPLILSVVGEHAAFPMFFILVLHGSAYLAFVFVTTEVFAMAAQRLSVRGILRTLVLNPILLGVVAGVMVNGLFGPILYQPIVTYFDFIARATAGCALFGMGGVLARYKLAGDIKFAFVVTLFKVGIFPLAVWYTMAEVLARSPIEVLVAVMLAGLPTGISPWVAAVRNNMNGLLPGSVVLLSTAFSAIGLTVILFLLK